MVMMDGTIVSDALTARHLIGVAWINYPFTILNYEILQDSEGRPLAPGRHYKLG